MYVYICVCLCTRSLKIRTTNVQRTPDRVVRVVSITYVGDYFSYSRSKGTNVDGLKQGRD